MLISNMHFQFLKRTFHRLLITGLTLYWKYHAPDESYRGCLASFENRNYCIKLSKFCIKLSKIQSRKNIDISVYFFPISVYRNSLVNQTICPYVQFQKCCTRLYALYLVDVQTVHLINVDIRFCILVFV
jgi:hypothetical protein